MDIVNERTKIKEKVKSYLMELSDNERKVLELRFGIDDDMPKTLSEVGYMLNISKEEVRRIEDNALKVIKERTKK